MNDMTPLLTRCSALFILAATMLLPACSPSFNWRDVRPDNTALSLLLPCKPDKAQRSVPLGGQPTDLAMLGCDAGGATFALAVATVADASQMAALQAGWQAATLANMKATGPGQITPLKVPGASVQPPAVLVQASGQRADGQAVTSQTAYFAQGNQLFQAVIYSGKLQPEVAETFFSSLKLDAGNTR